MDHDVPLEPCPCCGAMAVIRDMHALGTHFGACCTNCHLEIHAIFTSPEAVAKAWNRRVVATPPATPHPDTVRLDWIEVSRADLEEDRKHWSVNTLRDGYLVEDVFGVRAAIDAAMIRKTEIDAKEGLR